MPEEYMKICLNPTGGRVRYFQCFMAAISRTAMMA